MHRHSWIHRDLKLENMLVTASGELKICDFGWSAEVEMQQLLKTTCGTAAFWAPEMWECAPQDEAVDQWALGCLLYEMLAGHPPFFATDQVELRKKVLAVQFAYPPWFSNEACHAIASLLQRDPRHRIRCKGLFGHPWLRKLHAKPAKPTTDPAVKKSVGRSPPLIDATMRSPLLCGCTPPSVRRDNSFDVSNAAVSRSSPVRLRARSERPRSPLVNSGMASPVKAVRTGHIACLKSGDSAAAMPITSGADSKRLMSPVSRPEASTRGGPRPAVCSRLDCTKQPDTIAATPGTPMTKPPWLMCCSRRDQVVATPTMPFPTFVPSTPIAASHRQVSPIRMPAPECGRENTGQSSPTSPLPLHNLTPPSRGRHGNSLHVHVLVSPIASQRSTWGPGVSFGAAARALGHPAVLLPVPLLTTPQFEGGALMNPLQLTQILVHGHMAGLLPQPVPVPPSGTPQTSPAAAGPALLPRPPRAESSSVGSSGIFVRPPSFSQACNSFAAAGLGTFHPGCSGIVCDVF